MKISKGAILLMGVIAALGFSAPAFAAGEASALPAFGVVDMNRVMQTTDAAKDILGQLEGKRKEFQAQISKEENTLRAAKEEILKQKPKLSKEEFEKKGAEFEAKVNQGERRAQTLKATLDHAAGSSMVKLRREAAKAVAEVAKERKYSVVLTQEAVMISTPDLDMTAAVIERMNKGVRKIPVDWATSTAAVQDAVSARKK